MPTRDIVVIGGSAGAIVALKKILRDLPAELAASIFVVIHTNPDNPSVLPEVLSRAGRLQANATPDGAPIHPGQIYLPPPDHHLLLKRGHVRITRGPRENGFRPAIDPLFRSAAYTFGPRTVGVVLSGTRDDGAGGLLAIAQRGGVAVVQDPDDALHPSMPRSALDLVRTEYVLPAVKIGALLSELSRSEVPDGPADDDPTLAAEVAMSDMAPLTTDEFFNEPAGFGCPACGGALYELPSTKVPRYRCRVGHAWAPESLLEEQAAGLEGALWTALRVLEERAALAERLATGFSSGGPAHELRYRGAAENALETALTIRALIDSIGVAGDGRPTASPGPR